MGSCIICGASVDGVTCRSHEEDVAFEFRGTSPDQLSVDRFYRGSVDGFADFGVFVNIGDRVTGLLHRSEVDGRLESLDWEEGDEVFVQVTGVHDNGNVDLGWSIRQSEREFRGRAVHDPSADEPEREVASLDGESEPEQGADQGSRAHSTSGESEAESAGSEAPSPGESEAESAGSEAPSPDESEAETDASEEPSSDEAEAETVASEAETTEDEAETTASDPDAASESDDVPPGDLSRVQVEDLGDRVGDRVRIEGEVAGVRQTGGPTIFALTDETGRVECAAFVGAGERAYPDVDVDDVVSLVGEVERRQGELQVETESLDVLTGDARSAVEQRLDAALEAQAAPDEYDLLADDAAVSAVEDDVVDAATAIRRAVVESRPVIVRHTATVSGYLAGAAIERAVLPLVRERHAERDAEYHYVDRRPLDGQFYGMADATKDVSNFLEDAARHGESHPLVVLADTGRTSESLDALDLLDTYDAPRVVVDAGVADPTVADAVDVFLTHDADDLTAAALAANVAAVVNDDVREDLFHLPAISYWEDAPARYADLATRRGLDADGVADLRAAIAMQAHYQTYEDKREIVQDLLWEREADAFAAHVASQFRARLDEELDTVEPHVDHRTVDGVTVDVVDVEAFTHRFEFPPRDLLLDALYREARDGADGPVAVVGVDEGELHLRAAVDVRDVGGAVAEALPDAGVVPRGAGDGYLDFLIGERESVLETAVDEVATRLTTTADVETPARD